MATRFKIRNNVISLQKLCSALAFEWTELVSAWEMRQSEGGEKEVKSAVVQGDGETGGGWERD